MSDGKYKAIVSAAMRGESALWDIADALISEIGPVRVNAPANQNDGSRKKLKEIAGVLEEHGIDKYSERTLAKMRVAASVFDASKRVSGISFSVHLEAGSPIVLAEIINAAKSAGRDVSCSFARNLKKKLEAEEKAARKEAYKDAIAAKKEAEAEAGRAREEKRAANSKEAKEAAANREQEARNMAKEAGRLAKDLKSPPPVNQSVAKKAPADVPMLVVRTSFSADVQKARTLAEKMSRDIEPHLEGLSDAFVASAVDELLEIADAFRKLSHKVRSAKVNKRSHLYAVGE